MPRRTRVLFALVSIACVYLAINTLFGLFVSQSMMASDIADDVASRSFDLVRFVVLMFIDYNPLEDLFSLILYISLPLYLRFSRRLETIDSRAYQHPEESRFGEVALCTLIAPVFVVALATRDGEFLNGILVWILYVAASGLILSVKVRDPFFRTYRLTIVPAMTLSFTAIVITVISDLFGEGLCVSCGGASGDDIDVVPLTIWYLVIGFLTTVGMTAAAYARESIVDLYRQSKDIDVGELAGLKQKITLIGSILTFLAAFILATGS